MSLVGIWKVIHSRFRIAVSAAGFLLIAGCVTKPFNQYAMTPSLMSKYDSPFSGRMQIGSIDTGGTMAYVADQEKYQEAVYTSLKNHGLLRDKAVEDPVELSIAVSSLKKTDRDFEITIDAVIRYRVMDLKAGTDVIDQTIRSTGNYSTTAKKPLDRVLMAESYSRTAIQAAIRENMTEFLRILERKR
tara:strand:+ start:189 stop:752 length:564 start_codon:yes stop_codon:yes gene_type:complete